MSHSYRFVGDNSKDLPIVRIAVKIDPRAVPVIIEVSALSGICHKVRIKQTYELLPMATRVKQLKQFLRSLA
jgi:hypothetical protein